jgi:hypothetical protein
MSKSKLFDYNTSFSVIRTNPKISGNFKITVDSSGGVWFNSMNANETLSSSRFKKFPISGQNSYSVDLFNYFDQGTLSKNIVFQVANFTDGNRKSSENFTGQYDFFYASGASVLSDKNYSESFRYFQPLWIKNEIPDFFIILKVPGPLSYSYTQNQIQINASVKYKVIQDYNTTEEFSIEYGKTSAGVLQYYKDGDIFTGDINFTSYSIISGKGKVVIFNELENLPYVEDIDQTFREKILPNCSVVKTFDLRESSTIGKYIRSIFNNPSFSKSPLDIGWGSDSYTYFKGVSYSEGIFTKKGEQLNSFLSSSESDPMIDLDSYITSGFSRNGIICPNLLNLEFLFNDEDSDLYTINRYIGFYVSRNDIGDFRLNGDLLFKHQNDAGNSNSPKTEINNVGYYDSNRSYPVSSDSGVRLYYQDAVGFIPGSDDVNVNNPKKLFYVTDKNDNFYSLKRSETYISAGGDYAEFKYGEYQPSTDSFLTYGGSGGSTGNLVISNRSTNLLNFTGSDKKIATVLGKNASVPGNSYGEVEFLKNYDLPKPLTFKIYHPNGSKIDGSRKYDIVKSGDFSSVLIWTGGSYYSSGNSYYFNASAGSNSEMAIAFSSVLKTIDTSSWEIGSNLGSSIIRSKEHGINGDSLYSISIFEDYDNFESLFKGTWDNSKSYSINDIVLYNGVYYSSNYYLPATPSFEDSPGGSDWSLYYPFSKSGYIKINGKDVSDISKNVNFIGGSDTKDCRIIFDSSYSNIVKSGYFIDVQNGTSEILEVTKYVDEPIKDKITGEVISFNNFESLLVANLKNQYAVVDLGSDKSFNVYQSKRNCVGVFTFFDVKEFDFDFWSSNYSYTPNPETYRYYELLVDKPGVISPNIAYLVKSGQISYADSIYNQGSLFYGVTGYTSFSNSNPGLNYNPVVFPAQYSDVIYKGPTATNLYTDIDYYSDFRSFSGFIGIQSIMASAIDPNASKEEIFRHGKLNTEYEYLQENYTTERSNVSRIVPYINKWGYYNGFDVRGNQYRLNSSPAFTPLNFSPSLDRISIDPRYMTQEWFILEQPPIGFPVEFMNSQNSYLPYKIDLDKAKSANPNDSLYLSSYFTVEPDDYPVEYRNTSYYTKELFSSFQYNPASSYYETMFRGVKVVLKKRSSLVNPGVTPLDRYVPDYRGYEDYKFSAILRTVTETQDSIQPPVSYEVIENKQQKFILFVCNLVIEDSRAFPLGSTGGDPIIDYLTLYSAKDKTKITSTTPVDQKFISISDIKLSSGLDLSLSSGSQVNTTLTTGNINISKRSDYETDLREEINVYYVPNTDGSESVSLEPDGPGSFRVPAIGAIYPWPTGVGPSYVQFGKIATGQNYVFTIPFSSSDPVTIPVGPPSIYKNSPVFQIEGGKKYFGSLLIRCTSSYIAEKVNSSSSSIKYTSYSWNSVNSSTDSNLNDFELYFESPTKIVKTKGTSVSKSYSGPQELRGTSVATSYTLNPGDSNYSSILNRYSGGYEPIFRKVIQFDKDKTDSIYGRTNLDLSYRNCNFAPHKLYFGVSRNLSYTKVSLGVPILALSSSYPEGPVYPLIAQTPIARKDFNLFSSSWDPGYYERYLNSRSYIRVAGTRSMSEYKTFFGSKIMQTPDSVIAPNYITLEISRNSGTNDVSSINSKISGYIKSVQEINTSNSGTGIGSVGPYQSGVDYDKLDLSNFPNAEIVWQYFSDINKIKGIIRLDRILRRSLLNSGIKQVFIDNMISDFGVGDPDSINDDINDYIDLNVSPIYEGNVFDLYVKKTANSQNLSPINESVRGDLIYNDLIGQNYVLNKDYKLTMVNNLIYEFEYSLDANYNYSIQFNFTLTKI